MRCLFASLILSMLAACGDLNVRSIPGSQTVPAELEGLWSGTWASNSTDSVGEVVLRVQTFQGEPVVSVLIDNPCLVPQEYELVFDEGVIALQANGVTVFDASRNAAGDLVGTYGCPTDEGTWQASWQGPLPTLLDLSGPWQGRVFVPGVLEEPIDLDLDQSVQGGVLAIEGQATLTALPFPLPIEGTVVFRESDFELLLRTAPGAEPSFVISGVGDRATRMVSSGLLHVLSTTALPFTQALVDLQPEVQ